MPRKCEIDNHPKKSQIIKALINRVPYREITKRYGVTKAAQSRYLNQKLLGRAARTEKAKELTDGENIMKEIVRIMERCEKMYDACDRYLKDPDNPEQYYLGPRAEDIEVVYVDEIETGEKTKIIREKKLLSEMLKEAYTGTEVKSIRSKHADPRELLLKTANTINNQLELLARIKGQIIDQMNINAERVIISPLPIEKKKVKE